MRLVLIEWLDSHSGHGWQTVERIQRAAEPLYCRSVGWLLAERKDCKIIVPHIGGERRGAAMLIGCGDLVIPAKAIVKMTVLRKRQDDQ